MTKDDETVKKTLKIKWNLMASKNKWFKCLQVANFLEEDRLAAISAFKMAQESTHKTERKDYLNQSLKHW